MLGDLVKEPIYHQLNGLLRKMIVAGNFILLRTRAHSMLMTVPLPSSFAPGAASVMFALSLLRES